MQGSLNRDGPKIANLFEGIRCMMDNIATTFQIDPRSDGAWARTKVRVCDLSAATARGRVRKYFRTFLQFVRVFVFNLNFVRRYFRTFFGTGNLIYRSVTLKGVVRVHVTLYSCTRSVCTM